MHFRVVWIIFVWLPSILHQMTLDQWKANIVRICDKNNKKWRNCGILKSWNLHLLFWAILHILYLIQFHWRQGHHQTVRKTFRNLRQPGKPEWWRHKRRTYPGDDWTDSWSGGAIQHFRNGGKGKKLITKISCLHHIMGEVGLNNSLKCYHLFS